MGFRQCRRPLAASNRIANSAEFVHLNSRRQQAPALSFSHP